MCDMTKGCGTASAEDGSGKISITVEVRDGVTVTAVYEAQGDDYCEICAKAACNLLIDKAPEDILGMRNDFAVFWVENMPQNKLWCSALSVMASKKAAADYMRKNNIPFDESNAGCGCI